jgi:hypothetical protein
MENGDDFENLVFEIDHVDHDVGQPRDDPFKRPGSIPACPIPGNLPSLSTFSIIRSTTPLAAATSSFAIHAKMLAKSSSTAWR